MTLNSKLIIKVGTTTNLNNLISALTSRGLSIDDDIDNVSSGYGISIGTSKKYDVAYNSRFAYYEGSKFSDVTVKILNDKRSLESILSFIDKNIIPNTAKAVSDTALVSEAKAAIEPVLVDGAAVVELRVPLTNDDLLAVFNLASKIAANAKIIVKQ